MGCYQTKKRKQFNSQNSLNPQFPTSIKGDQFLLTPKCSEQATPNLFEQNQPKDRSNTEFEQISSRKYPIRNSPKEFEYFKQVRNLGWGKYQLFEIKTKTQN
ncbi:hypothetical protein pb186bvf_002822 [Paramecium bursaria]